MSVVARIEAWPVNVPLEATYLMAPGSYPGMSRTVVRVTTGDGIVGLGETPSPTDAPLLAESSGRRSRAATAPSSATRSGSAPAQWSTATERK